jgi:hypothetical protein
LKQFYIDFNVPGLSDTVPTNVRIGTQWLAIRSHVFLGADGATLRIFTQPGPVRLYLNWSKPWEGADHQYDDTDIYSTRVVLALPDFPVQPGMFFAYMNSNDYNWETITGAPQGFGAGEGDGEFWWLGFNVDGKLGPVALKTDFVYFDGEAELSSNNFLATFGVDDAEFNGWALYADANVALGPATVGGTFFYASGDDVTDSTFSATNLKPEFNAYRIPPGSEANPALGVVFWASATNDAIDICGGSNGNRNQTREVQQRWYGGLWTAKGYASFKPLDWLKVTGYAMYIGDTTKDGNTIGNAVDATETSGLEDEDEIGIEIGAIVDLSIYKNLTYSMAAGVLFAGDALDTVDAAGLNDSPDDPWAIVSQLIYKF